MNELQEEEEKLRKIINIVRPTTLPALTKPQVEENTSKVEKMPKINPTSYSSQLPKKLAKPIEIKKIDKNIKPNVEDKIQDTVHREKDELKEAEGIII